MTRHQSFKRLVRTRMAKTGESYTAARATLLAAREPDAGPRPALATSDEMIRQRTGRGWEEWFDLLDGAGLAERPHRDIARWVAELQGADRQRRVGRESTAVGAGGRGPALPGPGGCRRGPRRASTSRWLGRRPGPRPGLVDRVPCRALGRCHRSREHPVEARSDTRRGLAREAARGRCGRQCLAVSPPGGSTRVGSERRSARPPRPGEGSWSAH